MTAREIEEQISTKQQRRAGLAQDLEQTRAHLADANRALVDGTGAAEAATAIQAREMVLAPALATLDGEIAQLQQQVIAARKSEEEVQAQAEYKDAVAQLEAESAKLLAEVREFSRHFCQQEGATVAALRDLQAAESRMVVLGLRDYRLTTAAASCVSLALVNTVAPSLEALAGDRVEAFFGTREPLPPAPSPAPEMDGWEDAAERAGVRLTSSYDLTQRLKNLVTPWAKGDKPTA